MSLTIRPAGPGDEPAILKLTREFLALSPYTTLFPPKEGHLDVLFAKLIEFGRIFVAANKDDVPVGLIAGAIVIEPLTGENYAEGVIWYVDASARGGDTGRNLLGSFKEWASTNGATVVKMSAPAGSPVGRLLESLSYIPLETHFVLPLQAPTATGPVVLTGVTSDLLEDVRQRRQGGRSGKPEPTHSDRQHDDADRAGADDGKNSPA
jgi:hypothetical protein